MQEYPDHFLDDLYRFVHDYGWNWGLVRGCLNRRYGTSYTAAAPKHIYSRYIRESRQ